MKVKILSILIISIATFVVIVGCSVTSYSATTPSATWTAAQDPGPWPGVSVYRDSNSLINTRINGTFSIILQPAPLFGWGWQNNDSSAFSLMETKTIPGTGDEPNPFGPNAFLFKAIKTGTFQIILYVPSKPPQQLESFDIVVNP